MQISSLVITLDPDLELQAQVFDALQAKPCVTVGAAVGNRVPVVLEVESGADPRQEYDRIRDLPGVIHVEVAFVSIDDPRS